MPAMRIEKLLIALWVGGCRPVEHDAGGTDLGVAFDERPAMLDAVITADAGTDLGVAVDRPPAMPDVVVPPDSCTDVPAWSNCTADRDCSGTRPLCDVAAGQCVQCNRHADCAAPLGCLSHTCQTVTRCTTSDMCPGQVCSTALGVCVGTAVRPLAPQSTAILGGLLPRFKWHRDEGVDGVRMQLCADRACTRVESTTDLSGDSFRPTAPLSPGVHFWRLFARVGTTVSASSSPVWEFLVPAIDGSHDVGFIDDVDGDGLVDRVTENRNADTWEVTIVRSTFPSTPLVFRGDAHMERLNSVRVAGDLDGDGLGDLLLNLTPVGADGLEVSPGRSLVWVRGDASLADARLRTIEFALPESGVGASRTGDLDGDGYADLRVSRRMPGSFPFAPAELRVLFGAPDGPVHPSPEIDLNQGHFHREYTNSGDFNGDGATDLAAYEGMDPQSDITGGFALAMSFAGPGRSVTPVGWTSQCAAAAAAIGPLDVFGAGFAVLDADGDGFDDLRLHLAYSHGTVTWYGCPNFFASGRCTFEP